MTSAAALDTAAASTVDPADVARFQRLSRHWWDPAGPFAALHRMNPARVAFIRQAVAQASGRDAAATVRLLSDLRVLDVGCGGGLLAEALARLGGQVTAIDADGQAIAVARAHAAAAGLAIDYRAGELGDLAAAASALDQPAGDRAAGDRAAWDVVVASEVIEHVADVALFLDQLVACLRPGGVLVLTTLNRTALSFALGIVAAEYVLGLIPRGTHRWRQFLRPSEVAQGLTARGCRVIQVSGILPDPLARGFRLVPGRVAVNYALAAVRGA